MRRSRPAQILDGLRGKFDEDRITHEELSRAAALAGAAASGVEAKPAKRVRHNFTVEIQLAQALRAERLDPDDPAVVAAIDLVRWELSL